jgi:hypothetical protein
MLLSGFPEFPFFVSFRQGIVKKFLLPDSPLSVEHGDTDAGVPAGWQEGWGSPQVNTKEVLKKNLKKVPYPFPSSL